jgi:plastocyanin domain-containing protein
MKTFRYALLAVFALTLAAPAARAEKASAGKPRVIEMSLTDAGLAPADVKLTKGEPVKIAFTRKTERTCMFDVVIPEAGVKKAVPINKTVELEFTPSKSGTLRITCGMGMQFGRLVVN